MSTYGAFTIPATGDLHDDCSTLLHLTSVKSALSILKTGEIYGKDVGGHANFSVKRGRPDLARSSEVCMTFACTGPHHLTWFYDPGLSAPAGFNQQGVLHRFTDEFPKQELDSHKFWTQHLYWQSFIYPGWADLSFIDIQLQKPPAPPSASPWSRWVSDRKGWADRQREYQADLERLNELEQVAKARKGWTIKVVLPPTDCGA